jgi:hypothetical protein
MKFKFSWKNKNFLLLSSRFEGHNDLTSLYYLILDLGIWNPQLSYDFLIGISHNTNFYAAQYAVWNIIRKLACDEVNKLTNSRNMTIAKLSLNKQKMNKNRKFYESLECLELVRVCFFRMRWKIVDILRFFGNRLGIS